MTRYWFKRRRFGYGWTPVTREGWLTLGAYTVMAIGTPFIFSRSVFLVVIPTKTFRPGVARPPV